MNQPEYKDGQELTIETTLLSEPRIKGKSQQFSVHLQDGTLVFITTTIYPQLSYGDTIQISGDLKERVLDNKKILLAMSFPKIQIVKKDEVGLALVTRLRQSLTEFFLNTLPAPHANVLLGIVFGVKEGIPQAMLDDFKKTGILHITAASGMNVSMVGSFLTGLFGAFLRRQYAVLASIAGICLYAVLAGLEPSIVRASIMGIVAFSAQLSGRQYLAVYGLFLASFGMLFVAPYLLFDVGFQLSFAATLGLITIRPLFDRYPFFKNNMIGKDFATTISAQLATLPILISTFGTYSLWSVVVNGLVLWTIPFLMIFGGMGAIVGLVIPTVGGLFLYLTLPLLTYFTFVVQFFANNIGTPTSFENIPTSLTIGFYLLLASLVLFVKNKSYGTRKLPA
ncbi:MAG: ComEC/Rec2 family competence protein [Candidatus Levybacteria bacterium]|nr:ComEC/Rec2 family competence protein [Candidatus Levybacteria bacterium]